MTRAAPDTRSTREPAIVFDFAGVLFGWHPPSMLKRELPHLAHDDASAAHWAAKIFQSYEGDWAEFDRGRIEVPDLVVRIAARTGLLADDVQRVIDAVPRELRPIEPTVALLAKLRDEGHRLFFLSNMPAPYAARLEAENPFVGWFDDGVFSARVGANKPEPAIFGIAETRFGLAPDQIVFLDDHAPNVIAAARERGWRALLFVDAAQAERELRDLLVR